ncbi:MAG TPA: TolC family protein [Bryobacteraceae bacterium]|nr:TolC family protein [Bryobacteraceae bacterium]
MKSAWILVFPLAWSGVAADQGVERGPLRLSLKRAVEIATSPEGNANIQLSGEALKQAQQRSAESRAALLPDFEASLTDRSSTTNLGALGINVVVPIPGFHFPTFVGPYTTMDARVTGSQSIFDFSSIRRFQASKVGISAARSDAATTEERVAADVARAYLAAVKTDTDVETAQANVTLSQAVLTQADNQKKAGTGTGIEITRAKVQLANDQQQLLAAQNARRAAHLRLLRAMGLRLDTEAELTDRLQYTPVDTITLEQAKVQALQSRPDYKAQQERESNARLSASATKMERLPSLQAFGDYGAIGTGPGNALPTRTYGVSLRVPVFDGGKRDARRAESESQYRSERVRTNDLKEQVELDVRLALDALKSAEDEVQVAKDGLELAGNELTQARRRYEAGVANSLEVTDAQTRLERARDNQTAALYNYNLARIDLAQSLGKVKSMLQ